MPGFDATPKPSKTHQTGNMIFDEPVRLIKNYRVMREDETVSWSWISPGFSFAGLSDLTIQPVQNLSGVEFVMAEEAITKGLNQIFSFSGGDRKGMIHGELKSAIVEMKPRKGFAGRYVPFVDDTTYIEVEIIMLDKNTETPLCQIIHYSKEVDFQKGIDLLLKDISVFVTQSLGG